MASQSQPSGAPKSAAPASEPSAAHTPGPWRNGIDDLEGIVAPDQPGLGNVICLPPEPCMYSSLDHWPANARLIAAAPELLRCAMMAMEGAPDDIGDHEADGQVVMVPLTLAEIKATRAAIAKATGATS